VECRPKIINKIIMIMGHECGRKTVEGIRGRTRSVLKGKEHIHEERTQ
jgi:hypothetical protein